MSCNSYKRGCQGGSAYQVDNAFKNNGGISNERDFPYRCGGGDAHLHFEKASTDCAAYPWGATCASKSALPGWVFGGISVVTGEEPMKTLIAQGNSLYVAITVYDNFMSWKTGVYSKTTGTAKGGHAVVAMGYGVDNNVKYWILQNSWGPTGWGVNGFGKFLRGTNLAGVEKQNFHIRAWVKGGTVPPCQDSQSSGLTSGGKVIPCSSAKTGGFGDLCANDIVKTNCPITCNSCPSIGPDAGAPYKPPPPTPGPPAPSKGAASDASCIKDATKNFRGYECVFTNTCTYTVKVQCPSLPCEHQILSGGYRVVTCNGKTETDICKAPATCKILKA